MSTSIDGVLVTDLKMLPNERGRLMEVQRSDDSNFPGFGQVYVTQSFPGVVKAWYRHHLQIDQIAVITGSAILVLYDDRPVSATNALLQEITLGDLTPRLVLIPPMIWHGFKALGDTSTFFLHLNARAFDFDAPDEERRPVDDPRIPYSW